ncbi:MAG: hypothetical protein H7039_23095, partial [Bryobacteraceae bacterium]|nr:hypothetical protein [Bryobacteraceae bacterium]
MSGATLGVVVISHRHEAFLEHCLSSLQPGLQDLDTKVLLVDNVGDTD